LNPALNEHTILISDSLYSTAMIEPTSNLKFLQQAGTKLSIEHGPEGSPLFCRRSDFVPYLLC